MAAPFADAPGTSGAAREALFTACTTHYWSENPLPDPSPWSRIDDPKTRLRQGLGQLYAYYSRHEALLWNVLRDLDDRPELRRFATYPMEHREQVIQALASAWQHRGRRRHLLLAVLGHVVDFFAWRSLRRQGLSDSQAVKLMVDLVVSQFECGEAKSATRF